VAYNFQTGNNKIKLLTEYESVTRKVLIDSSVLAALVPGRKYYVIPQNGNCSRGSNERALVFRKRSPLSKCIVVTEFNMGKVLTYVRSWALHEKLPIVQPLRKLPAILRNPKVHHRVPLVPILSQFDPVHTIPSYLCKIHFNIVHPPTSWERSTFR
jgi:hypothetical protein